MLINKFKFLFALVVALLAPTFAMANQKVDDCVKGKIEGDYQGIQLILERCDLTADDMPALVKKLQNVSIDELEFRDNDTGSGGIGDKGLETLMKLKITSRLSLNRNAITDDGIKYLADSGIKYIELDNNYITAKGAAMLAQFKFLESLDIAGNFLADVGVAELAKSESIDFLDVSNNHIGLNGAISLSKNHQIQVLVMENNNISDKGFIALMSMPRLKTIAASKNNISDVSIPAAAANKSLNEIYLERNYISDAGALEFVKAAKGYYTYLDFSSNRDLSCQGIKALKDKYGTSVYVDSDCYDPYSKKSSLLEKRMKGQ